MIHSNPEGIQPMISLGGFIHPSAVVIGNVRIGANVFIGPLVSLRADGLQSSITIGDNCNILDGVILHAFTQSAVTIGAHTTLAQGSLVHGPCSIGKHCFVGFKTVLFKTNLADNVFVEHLVYLENVDIPADKQVKSLSKITTLPSTDVVAIDKDSLEFKEKILKANTYLNEGYRETGTDSLSVRLRGEAPRLASHSPY